MTKRRSARLSVHVGQRGYSCRQAGSGLEALAVLESGEEFELMLTDLMMAELDGIGLLERTKERFPDMPVVMVTAVHDISVALAAIRNGAYDYLLKPFEREQLLATVRRALENRRLKLENRAYQTNLETLVAGAHRAIEPSHVQPGALLRHHARSAGRRTRLERRGNRRPLQARDRIHHRHRPRHGTIPDQQIRVIARGAFLHDIGKDGNSRRDPAQTRRSYPGRSGDHAGALLSRLSDAPKDSRFSPKPPKSSIPIRRNCDGTGYPRGLKGDEIPLGSRIFAVADTLDAIMSDRPYRPAQPFCAARDEIRTWSGRQFDPEVVKVFLGYA